MHYRLCLSPSVQSPLLLLFNKLPTGPQISARNVESLRFHWLVICSTLSEIDQFQHSCLPQESFNTYEDVVDSTLNPGHYYSFLEVF
ncbi:hypothetical protein BCV71DRAFT_24630 [Rhizopus microsporus]|uniref:Uncharacterized protein n=1 Tax=Rhizopus microsporus TaxID=58291 RepID=A0A1X0RV89_RHIZD|nr:hypothetical protein BCV71DRAFT_24630 [Rhizopus microsporus]